MFLYSQRKTRIERDWEGGMCVCVCEEREGRELRVGGGIEVLILLVN